MNLFFCVYTTFAVFHSNGIVPHLQCLLIGAITHIMVSNLYFSFLLCVAQERWFWNQFVFLHHLTLKLSSIFFVLLFHFYFHSFWAYIEKFATVQWIPIRRISILTCVYHYTNLLPNGGNYFVWIIDVKMKWIDVSDLHCKLCGFRKSEISSPL